MTFFIYTVLAIALLGGIAAGVHLLRPLFRDTSQPDEGEPVLNPADMECCGQHEVCEKESLLAAISKQIEYYNDEELDRFRGREADGYDEKEEEEFREILYTMRSDEVAGWVRSLQLRQINLPDAVKDEVFLIVGERRGA